MCLFPIRAYRSAKTNENGKRPLVFNPHEGLESIIIPCGKCIECRLKKSKMWSLRCVHEAQFHEEKCFLTLTYSPENLPVNPPSKTPTLDYRDIQLFMKRLRKDLSKNGIKVRFFCSSEYGGKKGRPHYHMLLYGFSPKDLKFFRKSYSSLPVFRSKYLENLWQKGFVFVGTVTEMSAGYVARYTLEKFTDKGANFYDNRAKEKITMSRRQGIGFNWISRHYRNVFETGTIMLDNIRYSIPVFYRKFVEKIDLKLYKVFHARQKKYAMQKCKEMFQKYGSFVIPTGRAIAKELYRKIITQRLKRRLVTEFDLNYMKC